MFFSLAQTLVCVLLIQGGLYALHLNGNEKSSDPTPPSSSQWQPPPGGGGGGGGGGGKHAVQRSAAVAAFDATTGRVNKEIADIAQLDRERLMLLGLAKQTAESPAAGHHGRPIIAGRIQMQPTEDLDVGDYPALLQQAARGLMFGQVQKQPPVPLALDDDYEQLREYGRRPVKYDYGRVIQPMDRERTAEADVDTLYESPLHSFGDFDDFSELQEPEQPAHLGEEELLRELDAYQYHGLEDENPFRSLAAPESLQQLFEQEQPQRDSPKSHHNIRLQQKWARKRAQAGQQPLQRKIFGQHFKQQRGKLSMANSEATASKPHLKSSTRSAGIKDNEKLTNGNAQKAAAAAATVTQQQQQQQEKKDKQSKEQQQQQKETEPQLMHPNHKRSGGIGVGAGGGGATAGGYASPPVSHSIANQLMLRSARGQRQYDVPQIECPTAMDGMERFACPTPDLQGRYRCIDDHVLCDGFIDCPEGEDEDRRSCMFYKTTKAHLDVLADALLRWARGR